MQRTGLIHLSIHYVITERERDVLKCKLPSSSLHHPLPTKQGPLISLIIHTLLPSIILIKIYLIRDDVRSLDSEVLAVSIPVVGISPLPVKMLISSCSKSSLW